MMEKSQFQISHTYIYIYQVSQENYSPAANRAWADNNCHGSALFETLSRNDVLRYVLPFSVVFVSFSCL